MKSKTLIIVESPKKATTISKILNNDYIVLASYGHIFDLVSNKKYPWGVDVNNEFLPHYNIIPDKKPILKSIIGASTQVDKILLASDNDREGESIAFHLAEALESTGKEIKRITFNEITEKEIKKSIKNPKDLNKSLNNSQQARRVLDRIVGFAVSAYLNDKNETLSAGRVQSVALKMITDREQEIGEFVPKKYWNIIGTLNKNNKDFEIKYIKPIEDIENVGNILNSLKNEKLIVHNILSQKKEKPTKPPFTTLTLTSMAHSELGFTAAKTMQLAQSLYEDGFITYMRTDSVRVSDDAIKEVRELLKEKYEIPNKPNVFSNKDLAQDAHEAIRPTSLNNSPETLYLSQEYKDLYTLIWNRFLASQMLSAVYDTTSIEFINDSKFIFKAQGKTLVRKGWLELINESDKDVLLPVILNTDTFICKNPKSIEKVTSPPPRYNERTLIEELENKGIGRPSTYATIIPKILERNYIQQKKDIFIPQPTGMKIIKKLAPYFSFMQYAYTANMESKLDQIAHDKLSYKEMISSFYKDFSKELKFAYAKTKNVSDIVCPKCNSITEKFDKNNVTYVHCLNFPACDYKLSYRVGDETKTQLTEGNLCKKCGFFTYLVESEIYGNFWACARFPRCEK